MNLPKGPFYVKTGGVVKSFGSAPLLTPGDEYNEFGVNRQPDLLALVAFPVENVLVACCLLA
jgi:hypothetical protein